MLTTERRRKASEANPSEVGTQGLHAHLGGTLFLEFSPLFLELVLFESHSEFNTVFQRFITNSALVILRGLCY